MSSVVEYSDMAKLTMKEKAKLRDAVSCEHVSFKKNGSIEFKQSFFFRNGGSADKLAERLTSALAAVGFKMKVVSAEEQWKAWPKTSYWVVVAHVKAAKVETAQ